MRKQTIEYNTPPDALVAVAWRLSQYESHHAMPSEDFFDNYNKGRLDDAIEFVEWANDYRHFLALRKELIGQLKHAV